jgi:hypothetical protein
MKILGSVHRTSIYIYIYIYIQCFFWGGRRGTCTPKDFVNFVHWLHFIFSDLNHKIVISWSQTESTATLFFRKKALYIYIYIHSNIQQDAPVLPWLLFQEIYMLQLSHCDVTTNHPGQSYRTLQFMIQRSYVILTTADAVMYSWWWAWWMPETCRDLEMKAKII